MSQNDAVIAELAIINTFYTTRYHMVTAHLEIPICIKAATTAS